MLDGCCYRPLPIPLWRRIFNKINPVMIYRRWWSTRQFRKIVLPMMRTVYPVLTAQQIVDVQPMTLPEGAVFFLDYQYGKKEGDK